MREELAAERHLEQHEDLVLGHERALQLQDERVEARLEHALLVDHVLKAEDDPRGDDECEHHREAAEDSACDEVGREDRRVPAWQLRHGEVERND